MKQLYTIFLILVLRSSLAFSQNSCNYKFSVPDELTRGRYQEPDMREGHPYTLFNKNTPGWSLEGALEEVRSKIINGLNADNVVIGEYAKLYKDLYIYVTTVSEPGKCPFENKCAHPAWVKNNVIVYLIGLKYTAISDNSGTFSIIPDSIRVQYAERAKIGLINLNPDIIPCWGGGDCGKISLKAFDLIQYLESYDLLKGSGYIGDDRNTGDCSPRNKLREFAKNMQIQSEDVINSFLGWKKNHGVICASSLGLAAIVLQSAGTELNYGRFFLGWIVGKGTKWPRPNYNPQNWDKRARGTQGGYSLFSGEDGLNDLFFNGKHTFGYLNVPQTNADGTAGYAEGPGYFNYALQTFLPYVRARDNWISKINSYLGPNETKYTNMFRWYLQILNPDGTLPNYDNSTYGIGNLMGVLGEPEFPGNSAYLPIGNPYDMRGDYLLAMGGGRVDQIEVYNNASSGNLVIRNKHKEDNHSIHLLYEHDFAIDIAANPVDESHEDSDLGSITSLKINSDELLIDPGYLGWGNERFTNKLSDHSSAAFTHVHFLQSPPFPTANKLYENEYLKDYSIEMPAYLPVYGEYKPYKYTRNVTSINSTDNLYYVVNDKLNTDSLGNMTIRFNGTGNIAEGTCEYSGSTFRWFNHCVHKKKPAGTWQLIINTSVLNGSNNPPIISAITDSSFSSENVTAHANTTADNHLTISKEGNTNVKNTGYGFHTKMVLSHIQRRPLFQSILFPVKCGENLPTFDKIETPNYVATKITFQVDRDTTIESRLKNGIGGSVTDTVSHFHLNRWEGNIADSAVNPFNLPNQTNQKLYFDAGKIFLSHHTLAYMGQGYKYCPPSYSHFRNADITNGSYLIFKDTLFLSDIPVDFSWTISTRQTYACSIKPLTTPSSTDSICIKLPDVARGIDMMAIASTEDTLAGRYDSLSNYFYMPIPAEAKSFTIQTKQTCSDCYFPPVGTHIDTTFLADDGLTHTLGIPKNINFPHGNLVISNGTKINMCEGAYLLNRDSLILTGPAQTKGMVIPSCYGIDSIAQGSNNSMLVVSQASALVLNAGSKTFIKNGAAIYVKQNGSLVIKDGAYVQIGDSGTGGWGEIIVEAGGHVYIEPNAHIEYRRTAGDTADRNIFSIATQTAFAGVYFIMDSILKTAFILPPVIYPTPICSLDYVNPVKNKEWGYTNFAKPVATFQARKDTLCPGEPLYIKLNRILNDAQTQIKVCRMDSILLNNNKGGVYWQDTCIEDSILVDLILPDPTCVTPRITPEDLTYFFKPNSLNRVSISVINECGIIHDTVAYIFVSDTPKVRVSVPAMACEGTGTAYMRVLNKPQEPVRYAFELTELLDSSSYYIATYNPSKVYSYNQTGILPDTFYFTDYYFKGGRKYLASLSIIGACGSSDLFDTIFVPSGVGISLSKPKVYANPINGATSVQLNAHISVADSFRWEPTTFLNRTDTTVVISTPTDSIDYWIIAKYGACTATDTVRILYNRVANAGVSDTLCYTADSVLLGNSYDMSIFLGCLYYIGGSDFYNLYKNYTHTDPGYFRYFTHFMMHLERINDWSNCGAIFLDNFKHQVYRRQIMNAPWFKEYYLNFMQMTDPDMAAFDLFVTGIDGNSEWQNNLAAQGDWGSHQICTEAMFEAYNAFLGAHLAEVSCTWSKVEDDEIIPISHSDEWFVLADKLDRSTLYIQQVITPEYAEIDEVLIYRDTVVEPSFVAAMQWDSTVFFLNYTQPESTTNSYLWSFGDGSALSTETNPMHTFAAFDSAFVVCLSASNKCGTNMYCDTIRVDSAGLTTTNLERPASSKKASTHQTSSSKISAIKNEGIQLSNTPNPFLGSTQINYQITQVYQKAQLIVTDVMGKTVYTQSINKPIDNIQFNATQLPAGIYYYSIVLDNNSVKTKMMVVL